MKIIKYAIVCALLLSWTLESAAQYGSYANRAKNYLDGNRVRTVFYNYGLLGNVGETSFEWPQGTGNEYIGDVSPVLGVKFVHPSGDTLVSVCTPFGPRGNPDRPPGGGEFWGFEPLPGFHLVEPGQTPLVAMSDDPNTWPESWGGQWFGPHWGTGQWADQEAYFQMDDNADREWRIRGQDTLYAYPQDTSRGGLGMRVEARYLAFDDADLEDMVFLMYILHNDGVLEPLAASFGIVVGQFAGGRMDSQDDLVFFDSTADVILFFDGDDEGGLGWVPVNDTINVGAGGVFFLKSPADQGITSFDYFSPPGAVRMNDDGALWNRLVPGWIDANISIPSDCDFIVGTGYFALEPGMQDTVIVGIAFGAPQDVVDKIGSARELFASGEILSSPYARIAPRPSEFTLSAYPNPFNSEVSISLTFPLYEEVEVALFDVLGREVDIVHSGRLESAQIHYAAPSHLASGIYFISAHARQKTALAKVVFLK